MLHVINKVCQGAMQGWKLSEHPKSRYENGPADADIYD